MTSLTIPTPTQYLHCFPELPQDVQAAIDELSRPFPVDELQIRPGAVNREGTAALALAYQEWWTGYLPRLNDVVGPNNFRIRLLPWGTDVIAHLWAFNGIIQKWSSGKAETERIGPMDAEAQAKKRACAEGLMLGLYLYFLPEVWMRGEYDQARKIFYPNDGEERRCAYELYARAGLIAHSTPGIRIPRTVAHNDTAQGTRATNDRTAAARAVLDTAEQRAGLQPRADTLASDAQFGLIARLITELHSVGGAAAADRINAIGRDMGIDGLANLRTKEQLYNHAAQLTRLHASKLIDRLKAVDGQAQAA